MTSPIRKSADDFNIEASKAPLPAKEGDLPGEKVIPFPVFPEENSKRIVKAVPKLTVSSILKPDAVYSDELKKNFQILVERVQQNLPAPEDSPLISHLLDIIARTDPAFEEDVTEVVVELQRHLDKGENVKDYENLLKFVTSQKETEKFTNYLFAMRSMLKSCPELVCQKVLFLGSLCPPFLGKFFDRMEKAGQLDTNAKWFILLVSMHIEELRNSGDEWKSLPPTQYHINIGMDLRKCEEKQGKDGFQLLRQWILKDNIDKDLTEFIYESPFRETFLNVLRFATKNDRPTCERFYALFELSSSVNFLYFAAQQNAVVPQLLSLSDRAVIRPALQAFFSNSDYVKSYLKVPHHYDSAEKMFLLAAKNPSVFELIPHFSKLQPAELKKVLSVLEESPAKPELAHYFSLLLQESNLPDAFFKLYEMNSVFALKLLKAGHQQINQLIKLFPLTLEFVLPSYQEKFLKFIRETDHPQEVYNKFFHLLEDPTKQDFIESLLYLFERNDTWGKNLLDLASSGGKDSAIANWIIQGIERVWGQEQVPFFKQLAEVADSTSRDWLGALRFVHEQAFPDKYVQAPKGFVVQENYFEGTVEAPPAPKLVGDPLALQLIERGKKEGVSSASPIYQQLVQAYAEGLSQEAMKFILTLENWAAPQTNKEAFVLRCVLEGYFTLIQRLFSSKEETKFWERQFAEKTPSPLLAEGLANVWFFFRKEPKKYLEVEEFCKNLAKYHATEEVVSILESILFLAKNNFEGMEKALKDPIPQSEQELQEYKKKLNAFLFQKLDKELAATGLAQEQAIVTWVSLAFSKVLLDEGVFHAGLTDALQIWVKEKAPEKAREPINRMLQLLRTSPRLYASILRAEAARETSETATVAQTLKEFFGLASARELTAQHSQLAILSGLLAPIRQSAVGSCFGTAVAIQLQEHAKEFIADSFELLKTGHLSKGSESYPAARFNDKEKLGKQFLAHPLTRIWEYNLSFMSEKSEDRSDFSTIKKLFKKQIGLVKQQNLNYGQAATKFETVLLKTINEHMRWRYDANVEGEIGADGVSSFGGWVLYDCLSSKTPEPEWKRISSLEEYQKLMREIVDETLQSVKFLVKPPDEDPEWSQLIDSLVSFINDVDKGLVNELIKSNNEEDKRAIATAKILPWLRKQGGDGSYLLKTYWENSSAQKRMEGTTTERMTKILEVVSQLPKGIQKSSRLIMGTTTHVFSFLLSNPQVQSMLDPERRKKWVEDRLNAVRLNPRFVEITLQKISLSFPIPKEKFVPMVEKARQARNPIKEVMEGMKLVTADPFNPRLELLSQALDEAFAKEDKDHIPFLFADTNWEIRSRLGWRFSYATEGWEMYEYEGSQAFKTGLDTTCTIFLAVP